MVAISSTVHILLFDKLLVDTEFVYLKSVTFFKFLKPSRHLIQRYRDGIKIHNKFFFAFRT